MAPGHEERPGFPVFIMPEVVVKVLLAIVSCIKQSEELIVRELVLKSVGKKIPGKGDRK